MLGVVRAYAGMSLRIYVGIAAVLVVLIIVVLAVFQVIVGALPMLLIVFGLRRALGGGALLATATGVEFTPYPAFGSKPRTEGILHAGWADVTVTDGVFSVFEFSGRRIQVGPFGRPFTRAASLASAGRGA